MERPLLLPKLKTALACLYSNDPSLASQHRHEAHDFLLGFKSSNIRRAVVSRVKSQRDRVGDGVPASIGDVASNPISEDCGGSIFLSCLALLLQSFHHQNANGRSYESIFGAQMLNHRCRSIKLVETLDIEAEDGVECGVARLVLAWEEMRTERARLTSSGGDVNHLSEKSKVIWDAWLERYLTMLVNRCGVNVGVSDGTTCNGAELLALVLQRHASSLFAGQDQREEEIKGTLIMLSLAVAMYTSAFCDYEEEQRFYQTQQQYNQARTPWANSVLSDLGSALSVTALRVRYRPLTDKHSTPTPEPSCPPLVDMLVDTMKMVGESAETYLSQKIQQDQSQQHTIQSAHRYAMQRSIAACLTALPETVLLPAGHDAGHRIPSVDRACLRAASMELRAVGNNLDSEVGTGIDRAWKALREVGHGDNLQHQEASASWLLECCEAWARYVAVPMHIVEISVGSLAVGYLHVSRDSPTTLQQQKAQEAAFQYLVSIFESASPSLTSGDILTAALGVGAGGHRGKGGGGGSSKKNASTKKKQGTKSKKRHEKRLGRVVAVQDGHGGETADEAAEKELLARRNAACVAAAAVFGVSLADASTMGDDWGLRPAATTAPTATHGICSTVSAAASSVLPHLLYLERNEGESNPKWRLELFSVVTQAIGRMCATPYREIRALAYEPLMILHTSLNSVGRISLRMEEVAVEVVCECAQALATSCGYPLGYFDILSDNNDEELEIERNDIRDVARSVCAGDIGQQSPSLLILDQFVTACNTATQQPDLPPETVVHILSALAKPLNKLGKMHNKEPSAAGCATLTTSILALGTVCDRLNSSFESRSMQEILPLSRLALMGASSLAPMFASLAEGMRRPAVSDAEQRLFDAFKRTLQTSLQHAMLSSANIPELVAKSTLDSTRYDIKGAMRGPGGEDHVGCIALLRLSQESAHLTNAIFEVYGSALLHDLSSLYNGLKASELERGVGCDYGKGVTPFSRRMILRVISGLALHEMDRSNIQAGEGRAILHQLFQTPLVELRSQRELPLSEEKLYRVCEAAFDLSFFSPQLLAANEAWADMEVIFECVVTGYSRLSFTSDADAACQQWGRLRAAAYSVLHTSLKAIISDNSARMISALVKAECGAAMAQCNQGPDSGSNLFLESIVGEEMVHAGLFITLVRESLERISNTKGHVEKCVEECQMCMALLKKVALFVTPLLLHPSPEASSHVDPRPTIAEAWFLTVESLVSICRNNVEVASSLTSHGLESFLGQAISVAMALIFLKDMGVKNAVAPESQKGMSLDGPHTLAMQSFLSEAILLGPNILLAGESNILSSIHIQGHEGQGNAGAAVLVAAVLRAISGALPPWIVEDIPILFQSLYATIGGDCDEYIRILDTSTKIKATAPFGGVSGGELLAGRYLDVSRRHIESFLSKTKELCLKGDWKRLKVVLKATTGGKKRDSGFNLKPQFTSWECERL